MGSDLLFLSKISSTGEWNAREGIKAILSRFGVLVVVQIFLSNILPMFPLFDAFLAVVLRLYDGKKTSGDGIDYIIGNVYAAFPTLIETVK